MKIIEICEVCGEKDLQPALNIGEHPMCDDLVPVGDARVPVSYPIDIVFCPRCNTAHQRFQIPKQILFPRSYHYRAKHTADVLNGMQALVSHCEAHVEQLSGLHVLDVGCNDGSLLTFFAEKGARTFGIEPTGAFEDALEAGHTVINGFFAPDVANQYASEHGSPDIITFTNVFAHIEDLPSVLESLLILAGRKTYLVIENHYLGAVLNSYQFDTFYHEHPRTYSLSSFLRIARSLGARVVSAQFPERYGGNIRVIMNFDESTQTTGQASIEERVREEADFGTRLREMGRRIPRWLEAKRAQILDAVAVGGPLPAKAFPGRAAILVKLLGLDETMVHAVYEKPGSMKVGHYLPGTRIPIRSDEDFDPKAPSRLPLLNLAWHIAPEIHAYMRGRGYTGEIIDLFSADEFDRLSP